jgi:hypothetical protein
MSQSKTFTIRKAYVLSAINKAGERVYYDTDSHSGGWPYWSTSDYNIKQFTSLDKIPTIGATDYLRQGVTRIEVLEIKFQAKVIESTEMVSEARAKAMAEIAKIEAELARKIALLEGTK